MIKVWNKRDASVPKDAVYIGRGTIFGNPFFMHGEHERDAVCDNYELWFADRILEPEFYQAAKALKGKDLVCWCAPKRCHGDFLLEWANP